MSTGKVSAEKIAEHYPRNPFLAFLLSVFMAGLGQIYNGQPVEHLPVPIMPGESA